ncbi:MAG: hypothetical protein HY321_21220 [Armatimonadetes bacterium]|nr:hypothetical protein [Armatimonadota bacterium]
MEEGPRRRLAQRALSECLAPIRRHGDRPVVPNWLRIPAAHFGAMPAAGLVVTRFLEVGELAKILGLPATLVMAARRPRQGTGDG